MDLVSLNPAIKQQLTWVGPGISQSDPQTKHTVKEHFGPVSCQEKKKLSSEICLGLSSKIHGSKKKRFMGELKPMRLGLGLRAEFNLLR